METRKIIRWLTLLRYNSIMIFLPEKGLYAITNNDNSLDDVKTVLQGGAVILQYREKTKPDPFHAKKLKTLCTDFKVTFIINDNPQLAKEVKADGVHLGKEDGSYNKTRELLGDKAIIGISCYDSLDLAIEAENQGANYVAFGSFFPSKTKQNTRRPDLDLLKQAREKLSIPIVAIGGITPENGRPLVEAGADYIAAIHGVFGQSNPELAAKKYTKLFKD